MTHISNIAANCLPALMTCTSLFNQTTLYARGKRGHHLEGPSALHVGNSWRVLAFSRVLGERDNCSQAERSSQGEVAKTVIRGAVAIPSLEPDGNGSCGHVSFSESFSLNSNPHRLTTAPQARSLRLGACQPCCGI